MFLVRKSFWILPGNVLFLSVSFIVSSKPKIPFKPVPSDRGSTSPPTSTLKLHPVWETDLMGGYMIDIGILSVLWGPFPCTLIFAFFSSPCCFPGGILSAWKKFFLILTSCAKYTLHAPPSLSLPCYVKMTVDFLSLLPWSRHALLIFVFPETTTGLGWSELTEAMNTETIASSKHSMYPLEKQQEEKKAKIKVRQAWVCHPIIIRLWVFSCNPFHRVKRFNETIISATPCSLQRYLSTNDFSTYLFSRDFSIGFWSTWKSWPGWFRGLSKTIQPRIN